MGFLVSLLVLSFLVFFHELGHFLAARAFGVKVEVFSIGFGKRLFGFKKGDTEYVFAAIPLGGYVKMKGQNDFDPSSSNFDSDGYGSKSPIQKIAILLAGPLSNLLLAAIIYFGIAVAGVDTLTSKIGQISPNSAAMQSGVQSGDIVKSINGTPINYWHEISENIQKSGSAVMTLELIRDGKPTRLKLQPIIVETKNIFGEQSKRYMIGIAPAGVYTKVYYSPIEAISVAVNKTYESAKFIVMGIEKLITGVLSLENVGGVISIVQATNDATHSGLMTLMLLTALISVNLGVINLLPIPALDGGHIIFNLYELIFKKAPSETVFTKLTLAGWAVLLWLMLLGLYNDINRLTGGF